jgi:dephospho-CoA kinase
MSLVIAGLTGGIATGKSTVSEILATAGAIVIDADQIARDVVKKGLPAWCKIVSHFGQNILQPNGEINRSTLGDIIFNDPDKKEILNRMVHPYVRKAQDMQLEKIKRDRSDAVVILDVPLLVEVGWDKGLSEVIVVYAPEHVQLKRLMQRDKLSEAEALSRIRSQMPIEEKKARATIVIDNSGSKAVTRKSTMKVYRYLKKRPDRYSPERMIHSD